MSLLAQIQTKPCLLEAVDGVIVAGPLRFISLKSIAALRRESLKRGVNRSVARESFGVHADLTTQTGTHNHGA